MTSKIIKKRLNNLLNKDRSKNFIEHILRAYVPPYNIEKVYDEPNDKFVCAVTNEPLLGLNEVKEIFGDNDVDKFNTNERTMFSVNDKNIKQHPFTKKFNNKEVGITSKNTETYISYYTFLVMYEWAVKKYFKGDKNVGRVLKEDKDALITKAKEFADSDKAIYEEVAKLESEKRDTTTLGDLDELKELKNKMQKNE